MQQRTNFPRLDGRPLEALDVQANRRQCGEEDDSLETDLLPLVVLGLRRPVQEGNNILCHLRRRGGSA